MRIPSELKELSKLFNENGKQLYIVGGYVRDSYLGIQSVVRDDIDLCSNVTPTIFKKILKDTKFSFKPLNEKFGVFEINGKRRYEFACFRHEIYEDESHSPTSVEFINDLEEDARRRDFRINAIYYDIENGSFNDPLGGLEDLKDRKITTVKVPKIVFNDDPERILRLIRFACSLGLNIPEEEWFYAKQNAFKLVNKCIGLSPIVSRALKIIDEKYTENLSVKTIAEMLYVSPSALAHKFSKELNISVYRYITKKRLSAVRESVSRGESLTEAAINNGFSDYSCFYRLYKKYNKE